VFRRRCVYARREAAHKRSTEIPTFILRFTTGADDAANVSQAAEAAFAAVNAQRPAALQRWEYFQGPTETDFVSVLVLDEGAENPLLGIEAATQLMAAVAKSVLGDVAPKPQPMKVLGSYVST
jgi:hypothetical protein